MGESPLVQRLGVETSDVDDFLERVSPVAPGYRIAPRFEGPQWISVETVRTPRVGLMSVRPQDWRVLHEPPRSFFSVTIPIERGFEVMEGLRPETCNAGRVHVLEPERPFDLRTQPGSHYLVVNFDRALVDRLLRAEQLEGGAVGARRVILRTSADEGARFVRRARHLLRTLRGDGASAPSAIWLAEAEDELAALLIQAWLGRAGEGERDGAERIDPFWLAVAEEFMAARLGQPVSLAAVAEAAGTSVRSLTRGFLRCRGVSPMRFLRERRLDAAQRDLFEAEPGAISVTEVALRYGNNHFGRFAVDYRRRFGESPSETLGRWPRVYGASWSLAPWPADGVA